jgi:hypothetical protein
MAYLIERFTTRGYTLTPIAWSKEYVDTFLWAQTFNRAPDRTAVQFSTP